jgi:hypothetical protein
MRPAAYQSVILLSILTLTSSLALAQDKKAETTRLEKVMRAKVAVLVKATNLFAAVKDKTGADRAIRKMPALGKEMRDVLARANKLGELDTKELRRLSLKYKAEDDLLAKRFNAESKRLHNVEGGKDVLQAFSAEVLSTYLELTKKTTIRQEMPRQPM